MLGIMPASEGCCLALCVNDVTAKGAVAGTEGELQGAKVTFCRNAKCFDGEVSKANGNFGCSFTSSPNVSTCSFTAQPDGSFQAEFHFAFSAGEGADPEDGDAYSFDIVAASDTTHVLTHVGGKAQYDERDVCGQDCSSATL
jgi:hypothetical protein